jgi:hypothetical protein
MANTEQAAPNAQFRQNTNISPDAQIRSGTCISPEDQFSHHTTVDSDGTIWYDYPVPIKTTADLKNYGITWNDCRTLNFHGSERLTVFFLPVESRELAEDQWRYLSTQHTRRLRESRCVVPGTRKPWIKCPSTNSCAKCPFKDARKPPIISLDRLIDETGYEPETTVPAEEAAIAKIEYREICTMLNAEDERLINVLEAITLAGEPVKVIAKRFGVEESRIYQMLNRIKEIGQIYRNSKQ